jgi:Zn-dependent protease with chaperone function
MPRKRKKKADDRPRSVRGRLCFPEISPRAYEHPADRAALVTLRKIPGFDLVLRKIFGTIGERSLRLIHLASAARVGPDQFPDLWEDYLEACEILGIDEKPELYVSQTPFVNAGAVGVDRPFVVINSAMMILLDRDELQAVLGHELGHVLSGHALYKTMLRLMIRLMILALQVPVGGAVLLTIITALLEWDRKSELSADRAGLLVAQDPDIAFRVQMKLAGGGLTKQMNLDAFAAQAEEYESYGNVLDSVAKVLNLMGRTHPFPVLRLNELRRWIDAGEYDAIVGGEYEKITEDDRASVYQEIVRSASSYKESVELSTDPLMVALRRMGEGVSGTTRSVYNWVRGGDCRSSHSARSQAESLAPRCTRSMVRRGSDWVRS